MLTLERGAAARRAGQALGEELRDRAFVPRVGAVDVEHRRGLVDQGLGQHRLAARGAVHCGDGHAPAALARDAPVGPVGDHALDAGAAPRRDPPRVVDGLQRARAQVVGLHGDEPLRRGQEDHRVVAAPAVRVRVVVVLAVPQAAALRERRLDLRVGVVHLEAGEELHRVDEVAARVERGVDLQAVAHARVVVVRTVTRRRVHRARARLERHVVAQHAQRVARVQRVAEHQPVHHLPLEGGERGPEGAAGLLGHALGQVRGDDHGGAAHVVQPVLEIRVERDGQVRRDGPGRCRPDQDGDLRRG